MDENRDQYFNFLEELRKSGVTNMFGATPYLEAQFEELTHSEATEILKDWMKNYSELSKRLGWDRSMTPNTDSEESQEENNEAEDYSKLFDSDVSRDTIDSFLKVMADTDMIGELNNANHIWYVEGLPFVVSYNDGSTKFFYETDRDVVLYNDLQEWVDDFGGSFEEAAQKIHEVTGLDLNQGEEQIPDEDEEKVFDYETGDIEQVKEESLDEDIKKVDIKDDQPVKLEVTFISYDDGRTHRSKIARDTYLQALKDMVDKMQLYLDSDEIEEENMDCNQIIKSIEESNGDGCDGIISLKDLLTNQKIIDNEQYYSEEEW